MVLYERGTLLTHTFNEHLILKKKNISYLSIIKDSYGDSVSARTIQ